MYSQQVSQQFKNHFHLFNHKRGSFLHPILIALGVISVLILFFQTYKYLDLWSAMASAGGNTLHFCEFNRNGVIIKQVSNTWSNLGYLFVGLLFVSIGFKDHLFKERHHLNNLIARHPGFTILLGCSMLYLFIGSFMYHASLTQVFQRIDVAGIYSVVIALFVYNSYRVVPFLKFKSKKIVTHHLFIIIGLILNLAVIVEVYKWNINIVFPVLIVGLLILNIINVWNNSSVKFHGIYIWLAASSMATGASLWILDRSNILCNPTSLIQGHALWHILTALSVLLTYFFYRTETYELI